MQAIGGAFTRMRMLLNAAKWHVIGLLKGALAAFKESKVVQAIGGAFTRMRMLLNAAKMNVINLLKGSLAAFKENAVVKAIGGTFTRFAGMIGEARAAVMTPLRTGLAAFKESAIVKGIGTVFSTIGRIIGQAIGIGGAGPKGAAVASKGSMIGTLRASIAGMKGGAVMTALGGVGKIISGAFHGVLALVGGVGKVAGPMVKVAAGAGKGIIGILKGVTNIIQPLLTPFTGILKGIGGMVGKILWPITLIIGVFDFIKGFRKDKNWEGEDASIFDKIGMGIEEMVVGLIGLPVDMIKNGIAWIMKKFGLGTTTNEAGEEVESQWMTTMKEFSFSDLLRGLVQSLWNGIDAVVTFVKDLFADPVGTLKELGKDILAVFANFGKWLWDNSIGKAIGWVQGLFGWGGDDDEELKKKKEGFSLIDLIGSAVDSVWEWFKGRFDIDFRSLMNSMIPDWAPGWFKDALTGKEASSAAIDAAVLEHGQSREAAEQAGLYDKDWAGASEINREALTAGVESGQVGKEMLRAIIDDEDLRKKDLEFMEELVKKATEKGSLFTHDVHLEKLLLPLPAQMGALLKAFGGAGGGGGTTVNNVTVAPQTSTSVASTNIAENVYGTVDPYTNATGAYG